MEVMEIMETKEKEGDVMESIGMAFNLGVFMRQQRGRDIFDICRELREAILLNIYEAYGGIYMEDLLSANVEYFLQIALLGYILPGVCAYDEELKDKLFTLMKAKIVKVRAEDRATQHQQGLRIRN